MARGRPRLLEGEQLLVVLRRGAYTLAGPAVVLVLCAGLGAYGAGSVPPLETGIGGPRHALRWIVAGTATVVALRWAIWPTLRWYSRSLRITSRRLILCDGLFARRGTEIPLGRIAEVSSRRAGPTAMFGAGRLSVIFAGGYAAAEFPVPDRPGRGAPGRSVVALDDVPAVAAVHQYLSALVAATPRIAFLPPEASGQPRLSHPDLQ